MVAVTSIAMIIFGCNKVNSHDFFGCNNFFIATTYFGLQYVLLPRTMRVEIEAITTPLVVATIEYVHGKT
jgi:hypothetical protein